MRKHLLLLINLFIPFVFSFAQTAPPANLAGEELRVWLKQNWYDGKHNTVGYDNARTFMYSYIDKRADGKVYCVYSGYSQEAANTTYLNPINAEHSIPQSFFDAKDPMVSDIHHLYPTHGSVNSARSNNPFAEIDDTATDTWYSIDQDGNYYTSSTIPTVDIDSYSELDGSSKFEPKEDHKGDLARAIFYFYTMYPTEAGNMTRIVEGGNLELLYQWHLQDPVSEWELQRNNRVEEKQKNRNPYIDYPELACRVFGFTCQSPNITITASLQEFAPTMFGSSSAAQSYTVSASNLTADLTITSSEDFEISLSQDADFARSLTIAQEAGVIQETTIYVRFTPSQDINGVLRGYVMHTAGDDQASVSVSGYAGDPAATYTEVSSIEALRAGQTDGTVYKLTGEAILTFQQSYRGQKYLQDATAGIYIYDRAGTITSAYNIGDGITGLTGTLSTYGNMLQFVPTENPGAASSTANTVTPVVVTLEELSTNFDAYESRLVEVKDVTFTNPTGSFVNGTTYSISDGTSGSVSFRTTFYNTDYINSAIPVVSQNIVALPNARSDGNYITARNLADFTEGASAGTETDFLTFSFAEQTKDAVINSTASTIVVEVANGTDLSTLKASFTLSGGAIASIGGVEQQSGVTANNFSLPVTYTVTAQDGTTTQDWVVSVTEADPVSTSSDLIITGVIDGPLTGGTPKAIELYVANDIPDLSIYGVGTAFNGAGSTGAGFTFPEGSSATKGTFIYLSYEKPNFTSYLGFEPNYISERMRINGDDVIELFMNGTVVDVFGQINVDGSGTAWEYMDGWAYRKNDTGPDGATFIQANWTFSGINVLDGTTDNSSAPNPFPVKTYTRTVEVPDPAITVASESFDGNFGETEVAKTSASQSFSVSAENLTEELVITAPVGFELSLNDTDFEITQSITPTDGAVASTPVYIRFAPTMNKAYAGDVSLSSGEATATVAVSGTGKPVPTAIHDHVREAHSFYPNPAQSKVVFKNLSVNTSIKLLDLQGKEVSEFKITGNVIDISTLQEGIYILQIQDGNTFSNQRLMIER